MKKKKKEKKVKIKVIPFLIMLFIVIIICGFIYVVSTIKITNIYIRGNTYLNDQMIIEQAGIDDYPSFLNTSKSKIKNRLLKNPYIKKVTVKKKLIGIIDITIEENKILFRKDEDRKIVLEDGTELDDNGQYVVPILLNYVPDTKYSTFKKKMSEVDESIKTQISEIRYYPNEQDEDRFLLYMSDGNSVYLTLTKFKQINYYEDVLDQLNGKKGILYLDSGNHFKVME